jgi:hypothetical protein
MLLKMFVVRLTGDGAASSCSRVGELNMFFKRDYKKERIKKKEKERIKKKGNS